ncbi:MAG: GNAT family N-acetyltransferase [Spirochaetales bacterium]|nr:GNAT family N-acetyltransferase [Spirochaetales bacterium]
MFKFKGQQAALLGELCHGTLQNNRLEAYQLLYKALGEHLQRQRTQLHIIAHFAHDRLLQESVFQLGFGAFLAERIRDLTAIDGAADIEIFQENDFATIQDLEIEHKTYYRKPPIYLWKDNSAETVRTQLQAMNAQRNVLFVYKENGKPAAYFMVGLCLGEDDGRILRGTNTAQVLSAYAAPSARGRGIGKALLNRCIDWAQSQGFERLYVEHETANIYGGNFWRKHFSPYLYFSMRYVEDSRPDLTEKH